MNDGEKPVPVPDEQVLAVRELMERPVAVDPWPYMKEGTQVLVKFGPSARHAGVLRELEEPDEAGHLH